MGEWSAARPGRALAPGKETQHPFYGGWVGHITIMDTEARGKILWPLPGIEPRSPGRPGRSQIEVQLVKLTYENDNPDDDDDDRYVP
jgi:hypothetical protein